MKKILFILAVFTSLPVFSQNPELELCKTSFNGQGQNWCDSVLHLAPLVVTDWDTIDVVQFDDVNFETVESWIYLTVAHEDLTGNGYEPKGILEPGDVFHFQFMKTGIHRVKFYTNNGDGGFIVRVSESEYLDVPDQKESNGISIYPNPANDFITISGFELNLFSIYSISGELMISSTVGLNKVDVSDLLPGIYLVKCGEYSERLVIQ